MIDTRKGRSHSCPLLIYREASILSSVRQTITVRGEEEGEGGFSLTTVCVNSSVMLLSSFLHDGIVGDTSLFPQSICGRGDRNRVKVEKSEPNCPH